MPENDTGRPAKPIPARKAVRVSEAAKMLGIGKTKAYELVKRGEIPSIQLGPRLLLVPVQALDDLLARRAAG